MADQALSSITNFLGAVLAARALSPAGFGAVAIGSSVYFVAVALARSIASDVLVVRFAPAPASARHLAVERGLMAVLVLGGVMTAVLLGCATFLAVDVARVVALVALALPLLLVQDHCRLAMIMSDRSRAAAANDALWLVITVVAFALLDHVTTPWLCVGLWLSGGVIAAPVAMLQLRVRPTGAASDWFRENSHISSRYLGDALLIQSSNYAFTLGIAAVAGAREITGLRGAQVLMGPLSVLFLGVTVQAMPELVRRAAVSPKSACRASVQLGALFAAGAVGVGVVLVAIPGSVRHALLGASAADAFALVPAISCMFAALGASMALGAGVKAVGAVQSMLRVRIVAAPVAVSCGAVGFVIDRSNGAVFGLAIGTAAGLPLWWRLLRRTAYGTTTCVAIPSFP